MPNKNSPYHIVQLIFNALTDTLTPEEGHELEDWLKVDRNRQLYNKITSNSSVENKRSIYKKLDRDGLFSKIEMKIEADSFKERTKLRHYNNLYKYAAAVIVLAVAGYMLFTQAGLGILHDDYEVVSTISPGYERATLVLDDGSEIDLEKDKNQIIRTPGGTQIENRGNVLTYTTATGDESKVAFNTLHVPAGGIYTLMLPDGSEVSVNSSSSLKYPEVFAGKKRIVELEGEAYFDVVKDEKEFIVRTGSRDITVLGTSFNVSAYDDDNYFATTLVEGKIKLTSATSEDVYLNPGQRAYLPKGKVLSINNVDTRPYTAWKDGQFYFESESLEYILTKMSRWYNFEARFSDQSLKGETFTGVVQKSNPVEHLLSLISRSSNINYEITRNKSTKKYEVKISKE